MTAPIRLGLIGNGSQMRSTHLKYLNNRAGATKDIMIRWGSGCLCRPCEQEPSCPMRPYRREGDCQPDRSEHWRQLLDSHAVDALIISTPNALHEQAIRAALERGICVAVDKPPTVTPEGCEELVRLAEKGGLVFVTLAQRRFEDVYKTIAEHIANGDLGDIRAIAHTCAHGYYNPSEELFRADPALAGGGALLDSGYHGIDTVLWLCRAAQPQMTPVSVSAQMDFADGGPSIETTASVRVRLSNGAIFEVFVSYLAPRQSMDETYTILGTGGTIRVLRHRLERTGQSAADLTFQRRDGTVTRYDTSSWTGLRHAPLEDFLNAVIARRSGKVWNVLSPARDSVPALRLIAAAYESARSDSGKITLAAADLHGATASPAVDCRAALHHVAIQTQSFETAIDFYTRVLGIQLIERKTFKSRELAWLRLGNSMIELYSARRGEALSPWNDHNVGTVHFAIQVPNLDCYLSSVLSRGAEFHPSHPEPFCPPVRNARPIALLRGPDGEEIEVRDA
jgi:predicted dehydrogenase/catechol 2,3-dioxygenase-like lactoylglutathione lyase family enzyme